MLDRDRRGAVGRRVSRDSAAAMTSDDILDLREIPESLLVIGGGYIAVEFASILAGARQPRHPRLSRL